MLLLFLLGACSTSESSDVSTVVSSADAEQYDQAITDVNRAFEDFRVTANACPSDASCYSDALASSGVEQAVSNLQAIAAKIRDAAESGECRSSFESLNATLEDLTSALETLKNDAEAGDISAIPTSAPAVRSAWDDAVTAQGSTEVCFSEGFTTTTPR